MAREAGGNGVTFAVRLSPKAARDAIAGPVLLADGRTVLGVHVRAAPEKGKANAALTTMIAEAIGAARSRVSVVGGAASRLKTVRVDGDPAALRVALAQLGLPRDAIREHAR